MNKQTKKVIGLFTRYFFLLLIGTGNLYLFYEFLTPLTVWTTSTVLSFFTETLVRNNIIFLKEIAVEIVPACVAGAAFYLLFFLVFSTAEIKPKKRLQILIVSTTLLFVLNISRILILIPLAETIFFETAHWLFWNLISTIFVVAIWVFIVKIYKIKSIPIYSDFIYLRGLINTRKKPKRSKKH